MVNKIFLWCSVLFILTACKAKVPEDVVDKSTMEDLLYDYHLAQALAKKAGDSVDYRTRLYTEAVFRKYDISEEDFNHTMEWYTRNSEELYKIYQKVEDRYASVTFSHKNKGNFYADMRAEGDTMNVWRGPNFYLLTSTWRNRIDFELPADSTYQEGDRIMWQFDTQWFYRERDKTAMSQLAVIYENDSVASNSLSLISAGRQDLYIKIGKKPIKSIHGFVYLQSAWSEQPRILVVSEPVLVRFKGKKRITKSDSSVNNEDSTGGNIPLVQERSAEISTAERRRRLGPLEPKAVKNENQRMIPFPKANN